AGGRRLAAHCARPRDRRLCIARGGVRSHGGRRMTRAYRRKNAIGEQFAPRTIRMLESAAYRALSLSARRVLDRVEIELAHHGGFENGNLPVTFAQFEEYGIGNRRSIAAAIRECCALGFLEITLAGRAGNREFRRANLFRLTYRHLDRAQPTHEWTRI